MNILFDGASVGFPSLSQRRTERQEKDSETNSAFTIAPPLQMVYK